MSVSRTQSRMAKRIEEAIRRLTLVVRGQESESRPGWWVLACGESYGDKPFTTREMVRERLLDEVTALGIRLKQNIWIWDDTDQVLLVITTLPTRERAENVAKTLRLKGLDIRVTRETI